MLVFLQPSVSTVILGKERERKLIAPPIESELSFSTGTFLINFGGINRKPDLLVTRSPIQNEQKDCQMLENEKKMPDATVETTTIIKKPHKELFYQNINCY